MQTIQPSSTRILGSFALAMISISAILNLRELPIMASVGMQAIFFYAMALIGFLIPSSLVCAELSSTFPINGGIYTWVSKAFGHNTGFVAIWMEWINNVIGFPATLATIVATLAYVGIPGMNDHKFILFIVMNIIWWSCTLFNLLEIKTSSMLNVLAGIFGILFLAGFITFLSGVWLYQGHPAQISLHDPLLPTWHFNSLVFFLSVLSAYSGMQVTSFHAINVKSPSTTFPRAILIAAVLIFIISTVATLAIAVVIPKHDINLINGMIEGFAIFLQQFNMSWFVPVLAFLIAFSAVASLNAWVIAPARGLHEMTRKEHLPIFFAKSNRNGMPVNILLLQGIIGTALTTVFVLLPTLESAFWLLIALTSQFTVMMYILIFASAIRLRYSHFDLERPYKIPGRNAMVWLVGCVGIATCGIGFVLGFLPPAQIHFEHHYLYIVMIIIADLIIVGAPLYLIRKKLKMRALNLSTASQT